MESVIKAVESGDPAALTALLHFRPYPCGSTEQADAYAPACPDGVTPGTRVGEYILVGDCHGRLLPSGDGLNEALEAIIAADPSPVAVVKARENPSQRAVIDYLVIAEAASGAGRALGIAPDGIVSIHYGCASDPHGLVDFYARTGPGPVTRVP